MEEKNIYKIVFKDGATYCGEGYIKNNSFYMHGDGVFKDEGKSYEYNGTWVEGVK